jgi:hypothetical protein
MKVTVMRTNGTEETVEIPKGDYILPDIYKLINCDCIDIVRLRRDKKIMLVDDNGLAKGLPRNVVATRLYRSVCLPGTTGFIVGDVALVDEEDFQ